MKERTKLHVGLDVHKDSISVAAAELGRAPARCVCPVFPVACRGQRRVSQMSMTRRRWPYDTLQDASPVSIVAVLGLQRVMTPACVWRWRSVKETLSPRAKSARVGFGAGGVGGVGAVAGPGGAADCGGSIAA